jgi:hypothetical protein
MFTPGASIEMHSSRTRVAAQLGTDALRQIVVPAGGERNPARIHVGAREIPDPEGAVCGGHRRYVQPRDSAQVEQGPCPSDETDLFLRGHLFEGGFDALFNPGGLRHCRRDHGQKHTDDQMFLHSRTILTGPIKPDGISGELAV